METKHTAGEWHVINWSDTAQIRNEKGEEIATVRGNGNGAIPTEITTANAKLIAASPELLEALLYIVKWHRDNDSGEGELFGRDYITTAISAIHKATK